MQIETASFSDQGGRDRNEDDFRLAEYGHIHLAIVADGAGGHGGGDVASRLVVETAIDTLQRHAQAGTPMAGPTLVRALLQANDVVLEGQHQGGQVADMRSTAVLLTIDDERGEASWAHCGDSRLYWLRDGAVCDRTRDHSLVQGMVDAGMITASQAREHPQRNVLMSALGTVEDFDITALPEPVAVHEGDAFLLCTDGFWDDLDDSLIASVLARSQSAADWLRQLAHEVRTRARPGHDNYTAVAVWVGQPGDVTILLP